MNPTQRVRIIQRLCPARHCICAVAYVSETGEADPGKLAGFAKLVTESPLDPWCGICQSRDLHNEDAATKFQTLDEAMPELLAAQEAQFRTRGVFEGGEELMMNDPIYFNRSGGVITLTMSQANYNRLLMALGVNTGAVLDDPVLRRFCLEFVNDLNAGNPEFTPYELPEALKVQ